MNLTKFKKVPKLNELIQNEIQILSCIKSPSIIHFIEILRTSNNYYIIYEYCNGGTLEDIIKKKVFIPEAEVIFLNKGYPLSKINTNSIQSSLAKKHFT